MSRTPALSLIIATVPSRLVCLGRLLETIAANDAALPELEVVLSIDDHDETPAALARRVLPRAVRLTVLNQANAGRSRARNSGIQTARAPWLLFLDDDMVLGPETLGVHLAAIRSAPPRTAFLGRLDLPPQRIDNGWRHVMVNTPLVFFWDQLITGKRLNYRFFWAGHLTIRADDVLAVRGFDERLNYHEDVELGWRLERERGVNVMPLNNAVAWHDQALSVADYLRREWRSGRIARDVRDVNRAYFESLWGRFGAVQETRDTLEAVFGLGARQAYELLKRIEQQPAPLDPETTQAVYLAHMPLKRLVFCSGYLGEPVEWCGLAAETQQRDQATTPSRVLAPVS